MSRYPQTILGTCCVPWLPDSSVDEDLFRACISSLVADGLRDLYVFGTAGEGYAVNERQFDDVVHIFVDEMRAHDTPPMVGVISLSLSTIVERIERCTALGVELFQISLPSWAALNDTELLTFFAETCGRFPDARFLHYNLPRARRLLTPDEYSELATSHPNLVATKNAGADRPTIDALFEQAGELRHFFTEPNFGYASARGPCGFLISVAAINLPRAQAFFAAGVRGDQTELAAFGRELSALDSDLEAAVGPARIDGVYDKCISKVRDARFPLRLLPPYEGASEAEYHGFLTVLRTRYPHWLPPEQR